MHSHSTHELPIGQENRLAHDSQECLALVDVETYPAFVGKNADRLDMMAHFADQMRALTILSWKSPETARRFRLMLTEDDRLIERLGCSSPALIASGNLRTYGQVAFATHNQLFDCARHRSRDLLRAAPRSKAARPRLLHIPPGVYAITMYYDVPFHPHYGDGESAAEEAPADYTVIMRHYAFPPPRVAPVRLSAGFTPWAGEKVASAADEATSHKSPGIGVPKFASL